MDQKIDESYKKVLRIKALATLFVFSIFLIIMPIMWIVIESVMGMSIFGNLPYIFLGIFGGVLIIGVFIILSYINAWYNNYSFDLEDQGVRITSGVFTKSQKIIPYKKIQNLEVRSGIFDRRYGLSTILIETAGTKMVYRSGLSLAEGIIPGLREPQPIMDQIRKRMES